MQITTLAQVQERPRRVAVGEFDGVHLGHRALITRVQHMAAELGCATGVVTFYDGVEPVAMKPVR